MDRLRIFFAFLLENRAVIVYNNCDHCAAKTVRATVIQPTSGIEEQSYR